MLAFQKTIKLKPNVMKKDTVNKNSSLSCQMQNSLKQRNRDRDISAHKKLTKTIFLINRFIFIYLHVTVRQDETTRANTIIVTSFNVFYPAYLHILLLVKEKTSVSKLLEWVEPN